MFKEIFSAFKKIEKPVITEKPAMPEAEEVLKAEQHLIEDLLKMSNIERRVALGFIKDSTDFLKQI